MGNTLATVALFAWPLVVVALFRALPVPKALAISIVGGYLLLPSSPTFDLPLMPPYNKALAATLPALVMALVMTRARARSGSPFAGAVRPGWLPQRLPIRICFFAILAGVALTVLTNDDALVYPLRVLPALRAYDAGSTLLTTLTVLLPFLLARKYFARPEDQATLLAVIAVAALAYSLPTLWEVRMSPRLNTQIYGFFPHDWGQHLRAGGYRPVVFLEHGLRLGLFLAIGVLATAATLRLGGDRIRGIATAGLLWLLATLVLSKNLTVFLIVCLLLPVALALRPRTQLLVAAALAGTVLFYPMMRAAGLVPIQTVTGVIASFADSDRLGSLNFRFANEDILLEKANERPLFGWGGWSRARVYDSEGRDLSTTDGTWIIEFGENGWVGYLGRFGLLTLPVLLLAFRRGPEPVPPATSALAVVLTANLLDLLPNSGLTPLTWLMAGALTARLETRTAEDPEPGAEPAPVVPGRPGALPHRRQFPPPAPASAAATRASPPAAAAAPQRKKSPGRRSPATAAGRPLRRGTPPRRPAP